MRTRPGVRSPRPLAAAAVSSLLLLGAVACSDDDGATATDEPPSSSTTASTSTLPSGTLPVATSTSTTSTSSTTSSSLPADEQPVPLTALPAGFSLVSAAPPDTVRVGRSWEYGTWTGLTMVEDSAVVAFTHVVDPATGTTVLAGVRWDPEAGAWSGPTELLRGRLTPSLTGTEPVAMASGDGSVVAVVAEQQDEQGRPLGIVLHLSEDVGAGWRSETVTGRSASAPSAAVHEGVAAVGYWQDGALVIATRDLAGTEEWAPVSVPLPDDTTPSGAGPVVSISPDGRIGAVALLDTLDGGARQVVWWDGVAATPTVVASIPSSAAAVPVPLTATWAPAGPTIVVGAGALADDDATTAALAVYSSTDGGASFGPPAAVAADGPPARPLALSLATTPSPFATPARWAIAFVPDTTERGDCGLPKVAVGVDPGRWDACLDEPPSRRVVATGLAPAVAYDTDGRLNLALTVAASDGRLEPGVYLWRAPV